VNIHLLAFAKVTGSNNTIIDHPHILFTDLPLYFNISVIFDLRSSNRIGAFINIQYAIFFERGVGGPE
jgi:hypothetical protein